MGRSWASPQDGAGPSGARQRSGRGSEAYITPQTSLNKPLLTQPRKYSPAAWVQQAEFGD